MPRRVVTVEGVVQGVGFRPFVHRLAVSLRLGGFARNETGRVHIEIEGSDESLDLFLRQMQESTPPLARIERVRWMRATTTGERAFRLAESVASTSSGVLIPPDVATCRACLDELANPEDRRHCYPFINCTDCGPRLTIVLAAPYDRARTTMAGFPMCDACSQEYRDPEDRRFHAEPTACPACGPRVQLLDASGAARAGVDPLDAAGSLLRSGRIGAIKGVGGYHLVCDASRPSAVAELRERKARPEKPMALVVRDIGTADRLFDITEAERLLLISRQAPIVLIRRRPYCPVAGNVASGNRSLGVMLPSTALHHLLLEACRLDTLVMTSGNRSDEPTAISEDEALESLSGIADFYLSHDRPIRVRCDDSVMRVIDGEALPLRRSRGYAPEPVPVPVACPRPMLAVGGHLKVVFALGRRESAVLSHHIGDLGEYRALEAFRRDIRLYEDLFAMRPEALVHDLHPDYASTVYARERAAAEGVELVGVQHHHAHMASCMAENGLRGPAIGVIFDGAGYAPDGVIRGGEVLVGGYERFVRAASLRPVPMPGGEAAVREPWRMAVACLLDAGADSPALRERIAPPTLATVRRMIERRVNAPLTSSAGRLFDAAAAITGVCDRVSYEGQAAVQLEWLAAESDDDRLYPFDVCPEEGGERGAVIDTRPLVRALAADASAGVSPGNMASRFHATLAEIVAESCRIVHEATKVGTVVLSGGVFANAVLTRACIRRLRGNGLDVYRHRIVPPNDGGLSLGQLAVAAARTGGAS